MKHVCVLVVVVIDLCLLNKYEYVKIIYIYMYIRDGNVCYSDVINTITFVRPYDLQYV